ncbi:MAG TPA: carbohydrate ABC transporter permease [Chloroflexota bacterium]|jgi:putative aldouronate transport system permease protein
MMAKAERPAWMERPSRTTLTAKFIVLAMIVIVVVYPFLSVIATSLASEQDITNGGGMVLWPAHPSLEAYVTIFSAGAVAHSIWVSVAITAVGTLLSVAITTMLAYACSRPIVGGSLILMMALLTLLFPPGIIPSYLVVKQLGLLNNYASLILPVMLNAFNFVVLRQFFMNIPRELTDSARIDGASDVGILLKIVIPLSKPVLAVIALFYAVTTYWNSFFPALLYLSDNSKWPLQLVARQYVLQGSPMLGSTAYGAAASAPPPTQSLQMAVVVVAIVPILIIYPFLQKYFTRGVLTGAIKG